jgi:hypothetical protein
MAKMPTGPDACALCGADLTAQHGIYVCGSCKVLPPEYFCRRLDWEDRLTFHVEGSDSMREWRHWTWHGKE